MKPTVTTISVIFISLILVSYREELLPIIFTLCVILVSLAFITVSLFAWYATEKVKLVRATRIESEKNAHVFTLTENGQTWIRDTDHTAIWHGLHLEQRVYSNGTYENPSEIESRAWYTLNQPVSPTETIISPTEIQGEIVDLLSELDQAQRTLIVGASNSGKTTLLQHIISRRQGQTIVIDPHAYPSKWICETVGNGRDYEAIEEKLQGLVRLMTKRYDEIGRGEIKEGQHDPITVVIDEWRAITSNVESAGECIKTLLTESRKAAISVFVATHSDRAKPLGLEGEYDLKDGFCIVYLAWESGLYTAKIDAGNGLKKSSIPGPYIPYALPEPKKIALPTLQPNDEQKKILDLHDQGLSKTRICVEVFGSKGGKQLAQVKGVLSQFG